MSEPACGAVGQRHQEAALHVSGLIPLVQAMSLKLGHPNVEKLVAFGLRETLDNILTCGKLFENESIYFYLHVIENIARIQIDAIGLLVNSHYCVANIQGTLDSSPENLD